MKIEDIVCDFEYAEKLRKLGLYKRSIFWYDSKGVLELDDNVPVEYAEDFVYYTYTDAELGEMLPYRLIANYSHYDRICVNDGSVFICTYEQTDDHDECIGAQTEKKEANARAKLLIWLIENNHVNVGELNG